MPPIEFSRTAARGYRREAELAGDRPPLLPPPWSLLLAGGKGEGGCAVIEIKRGKGTKG